MFCQSDHRSVKKKTFLSISALPKTQRTANQNKNKHFRKKKEQELPLAFDEIFSSP
jgi:hypothetical protein